MFYEREDHKIWLINEMKCWILIDFFKKGKKIDIDFDHSRN